jgi:transcriptional regulator with XRE-family HTH domain
MTDPVYPDWTPSFVADQAPPYRDFLNRLRKAKNLSMKDLALKMGTPSELVKFRVKQLEHFFNDLDNPRAGFAKAVERALDPTMSLPAEDYGWDPRGA